jgi:hypothetical protein
MVPCSSASPSSLPAIGATSQASLSRAWACVWAGMPCQEPSVCGFGRCRRLRAAARFRCGQAKQTYSDSFLCHIMSRSCNATAPAGRFVRRRGNRRNSSRRSSSNAHVRGSPGGNDETDDHLRGRPRSGRTARCGPGSSPVCWPTAVTLPGLPVPGATCRRPSDGWVSRRQAPQQPWAQRCCRCPNLWATWHRRHSRRW